MVSMWQSIWSEYCLVATVCNGMRSQFICIYFLSHSGTQSTPHVVFDVNWICFGRTQTHQPNYHNYHRWRMRQANESSIGHNLLVRNFALWRNSESISRQRTIHSTHACVSNVAFTARYTFVNIWEFCFFFSFLFSLLIEFIRKEMSKWEIANTVIYENDVQHTWLEWSVVGQQCACSAFAQLDSRMWVSGANIWVCKAFRSNDHLSYATWPLAITFFGRLQRIVYNGGAGPNEDISKLKNHDWMCNCY